MMFSKTFPFDAFSVAVIIVISQANLVIGGRLKTLFSQTMYFENNQSLYVLHEQLEESAEVSSDITISNNHGPHHQNGEYGEISLIALRKSDSSSLAVVDCGSPGAEITNSSINGCQQDTCTIERGSEIVLNITFIANRASKNLWCELDVKKGVFSKKIHCPQTDLCSSLSYCPLKPGELYVITVKKKLSVLVPKWEWDVVGKLTDADGVFLCISAHIQVA